MTKIIALLFIVSAVAEQSAFQAGVSSIRDQLSQVVLNGKKRGGGLAFAQKNLVDSILSKTGDKLDDAQKAILAQVSGLLADILTNLMADRVADQAELDGFLAVFATCVDAAKVAADGVHEAAVSANEATHEACRTQEDADHLSKETACAAFTTWMGAQGESGGVLDCGFPGNVDNNANIDLWKSLLSLGKSYFQTLVDLYTPNYYTPCKNAHDTHASKASECDGDQTAQELSSCLHRDFRSERCTAEDSCYASAKTNFESSKTSIATASAQRVNDANMVAYVKCLVDDLQGGDTDMATIEGNCAATKTGDFSAYGNTFDATPAQAACDLIGDHPSSGTYAADHYGAHPFTSARVSMNAVTPCV